jgi:mono/diheme cytochrome c family protein
MTRSLKRLAIVMLIAVAGWIPAAQSFATKTTDQAPAIPGPPSHENNQRTGEQIFMENCSRCHRPPMTMSQRATGTIVMHMRVRAKLSREDEKSLLRYLAP